MELILTRDTLNLERLAAIGEEQVTIEGEATLAGSMRDAVTVLSVQAQAVITDTQAGNGEAGVRGRVSFQTLYTQGDLTKIRSLETSCDFEHKLSLADVQPGMRLTATVCVQQTQGSAASGRITLRALVGIQVEAVESIRRELITDARDAEQGNPDNLQMKMQTVSFCTHEELGEGKTLVREEFDLPERLGVGEVLSATGSAQVKELTGGGGRVGVLGVMEVQALHRPLENGKALVVTTHELPFELTIDTQLPEGVQPEMAAEVIDVMADSVSADRGRTLRVEAEVRVRLSIDRQEERTLLEDLYSLSGPTLDPVSERLDIHACQQSAFARESIRLPVTMPQDAPPLDTVLAAFVVPALESLAPAGRRLDVQGIMQATVIYLPVDSDIPYAVTTREPFAATFPVEAQENVRGCMRAIECSAGAATSDRVELRCVLGLETRRHGVCRIHVVTDVVQGEQAEHEQGFVLVWPKPGETRWQTARSLRVAPDSLRPAGKTALLAFRR